MSRGPGPFMNTKGSSRVLPLMDPVTPKYHVRMSDWSQACRRRLGTSWSAPSQIYREADPIDGPRHRRQIRQAKYRARKRETAEVNRGRNFADQIQNLDLMVQSSPFVQRVIRTKVLMFLPWLNFNGLFILNRWGFYFIFLWTSIRPIAPCTKCTNYE